VTLLRPRRSDNHPRFNNAHYERTDIKACIRTSIDCIPTTASAPTFLLLQPAPSLALQPVRLPIFPNQSKMPTVSSYLPHSTHDELLARCHSDRGDRVRDITPKLTSSLDYGPAADSDGYTFVRASIEPIVWEFLDRSA